MRLIRRWRPRRREAAVPQVAGELLARVGRLALWAAVAVVLVRGLGDVFAAERKTPAAPVRERTNAVWPDDAARAFAVEFALTYLRVEHEGPTAVQRDALARLAAPEIADALVPTLGAGAQPQDVWSATAAAVVRLDGAHALITVTARLGGERPRSVRLTIPIARDEHGGLVVDDLPALAPVPDRAHGAPAAGTPILGDERAAITDVLTRFLRAYLAGDRAGLAYLAPPGARIAATSGGFELLDVGSLGVLGDTTRPDRLVLATAHVRDQVSRASYALRFRVRLVRRDRWYVAAINPTDEERTR
jgi:Conjugative transposon protein TcpC